IIPQVIKGLNDIRLTFLNLPYSQDMRLFRNDKFSSQREPYYGKCTQCKRYNTSLAWCQSCDPFKTTQGWTSGNKDIDDYIKEFQLKATEYEDVIEWIPFNRLSEFQNISETEFWAQWLDGIRKVKNRTQSRTLSCSVELRKFDGLQVNALEFIRNLKNYLRSWYWEHNIYGITRDTTGQYMIVYDCFYSKRYMRYGECAQCERYNTSEAWCQSCDSFKTTQGWTSGNNDIDYCIKEFQLKATEYKDVIEWIPFNRLSEFRKINEMEFWAQWLDINEWIPFNRRPEFRKINEMEFRAQWLDGIRKVKNNTQSRTLSCSVELTKFDGLQVDALEFIRNFKKFIQSEDSKHNINTHVIYGITRDTTGQYMVVFDEYSSIRNIMYGICAQCERYNTLEAWCQSCDPFKTTQGWTSGNKDIDNCIKEFQIKTINYENVIEWIPFIKLSNLQKVDESRLQALWLDGIRKVEIKTQSRIASHTVDLKKFDGLQVDALEFIRNFKNYIQSGDKVYGITQDATGQYMIVFDEFSSIRNIKYGMCAQCDRYKTSQAWCQSCDPFKTIQGWTSGNKDIDDCIKEFQLKSSKYENVIEWIPFNRLSNLQKVDDSSFQALWLDGIRKVKNNIQSRISSCVVELETFNSFLIDTLEFIGNFKNHMQSENNKVYGITQNVITRKYMVIFDRFSSIRRKYYEICAKCKRYNTSFAWCQSCDPFIATQGWTSGNKEVDYCIKGFQLKSSKYENVIEWIPFNRLSNLQKVDESKFRALWLDGTRKIEDNIRLRILSCAVGLKALNSFPVNILEFIRNFKIYMQPNDNKLKVYGITQDTTTGQYMIVFDESSSIRDNIYGICAQCNGFNTSLAWCQSCDPFKATKGWTSGNRHIDDCIKEFQLNATRHEDVI
ncbi:18735_t:CDS:2, partial [Acaulospora morrowiae]